MRNILRLLPTVLAGAGGGPSSLLTSLVSYWKLDEESDGSGAVTRNDSVGANHLTDTNTTPSATGLISRAASFTAAQADQLSRADNASLSAGAGVSFEFAVWVRQSVAAYAIAFSKYSEYFLELYASGQVNFQGRNLANTASVVATLIPGTHAAGAWHVFFCGYDADTDKVFVKMDNGTLTYSASTLGGGVLDGAATFRLNGRAGADFMTGMLDEVGFWKGRILTPAERTTLFNGGSGITHPFDLPAGESGFQVDAASLTRAATPLTTPTYDGSGQAVHPDVYDAGAGNTWNGYRYWMALTPYPGATETLENPSILCSTDGETWAVPAGLTNPVIPGVDADTINSDPDLVMDDTTLWMVYREFDRTTHDEKIYAVSSLDGVTWSAPTLIVSGTAQTAILSPAVVRVDGTFYMYTVDATGHYDDDLVYRIHRRACATMDGVWSAPVLVGFPIYVYMPSGKIRPTNAWHIDVVYCPVEQAYFALVCTWDWKWLIGTSLDGLNFHTPLTALASTSPGLWDAYLYRASLVRKDAGFEVFYSAQDGGTPQVWRIGKTDLTVSFSP